MVINASPFHMGKSAEREQRMAERAQAVGLAPAVRAPHRGQDEVVFDGASFAVDARGAEVCARAPSFEDATLAVTCRRSDGSVSGEVHALPSLEAQAWAALVTGVRDYVGKNGFPGVIIGLSGASIPPWCWRSPSMPSGPTACAP